MFTRPPRPFAPKILSVSMLAQGADRIADLARASTRLPTVEISVTLSASPAEREGAPNSS